MSVPGDDETRPIEPESAAVRETAARPSETLDETRDIADSSSTPADEAEELYQGDLVGRYFVLTRLGRGGMGVVYKAYDPQLDRNVALKLLRRDRSSAEADLRLMSEARTLAKLKHPNVVAVYDAGLTHHGLFIAMELLEGKTLSAWLEEHRRPVAEIVEVFRAAGRGLVAAHEAGFIHRDFKPSNVLVGDDGVVRVLDFGLAHLVSDPPSPRADREGASRRRPRTERPRGRDGVSSPPEQFSTEAGAVMGTPAYMAPEQLVDGHSDHRSEQFSFAMSLYVSLYGRPPAAGETYQERHQSLEEGLTIDDRDLETSASGERVPPRVRQVIRQGLATDPAERFASMAQMLALLEPPRRRWGAVLAGSTLLVGFGVGAVVFGIEDDTACLDPAAALEQTWGEVDREAVLATFAEHGEAGGGSQQRVQAQLDEYASAWVKMYGESCRATFVEHRQPERLFDQRLRCLVRRRNRLQATIDALAGARSEHELLQRTLGPYRLPAIQPCGDLEVVMAEQPPPEGEVAQAQVADLRKRLDEVRSLHDVGDYPRGIEVAAGVVQEAEDVGYPPVLAESLEVLGLLQISGGETKAAEQTLRRAITEGARAHQEHSVAAAWTHLLFALARDQRLDEALALELAARAAVDRVGDQVIHSWLLNSLGFVHAKRGALEDSLHYLRRAIEAKRDALGERHVDVGIAWNNFGQALAEGGRAEEAIDALERAGSIYAKTLGDEHPLAYKAAATLCELEATHGRAERALELCTDVLADFGRFPPSAKWRSRVDFGLARAQWSLGHTDEARASAQRAHDAITQEDPMMAAKISRWLEDPALATSGPQAPTR